MLTLLNRFVFVANVEAGSSNFKNSSVFGFVVDNILDGFRIFLVVEFVVDSSIFKSDLLSFNQAGILQGIMLLLEVVGDEIEVAIE